MDVEFLFLNVALGLENWQTAQMPPEKKTRKYPIQFWSTWLLTQLLLANAWKISNNK